MLLPVGRGNRGWTRGDEFVDRWFDGLTRPRSHLLAAAGRRRAVDIAAIEAAVVPVALLPSTAHIVADEVEDGGNTRQRRIDPMHVAYRRRR